MNRALLLFLSLVLAACSEWQNEQSNSDGVEQPSHINILVFGDSGYQLSYIEEKYFNSPYETVEAYLASDREGWAQKNKAVEDYREPLLEFHEESGSYMPAAGQVPVADAMTEYCHQARCDFGVMLGDNIYPDGATLGEDGVDDAKRFEDLLYAPYKGLEGLSSNFRIYATLGNHDWHTSREGAIAQLDYMRNHTLLYMEDLFYSVVPPSANGQVELFVVDTEMLLASTDVKRPILNPDGSEKEHEDYVTPRAAAIPQTEAEKSMVDWFEKALKESNARYKIVIAHHPFWSAGGEKFEQARALRDLIRPSVCEHADAYFAGHEHTLEVYLDSCEDLSIDREKPVLHLISGAAGKQRGIPGNYVRAQDEAYPQRQLLHAEGWLFGFASLQVALEEVRVELYVVEQDGGFEPIFNYSL